MSPAEAQTIPIDDTSDALFLTLPDQLTDEMVERLHTSLVQRMKKSSPEGLILDLSRMDVVDSFAIRKLDNISRSASIMGIPPILIGMQPEHALVLVQMGLEPAHATTALSLRHAMKKLRTMGRSRSTEQPSRGDG